ncbi:MAG: hypothetical protein H7Y42_10750 [Chitinophagaceae bacterium]|nr:hypothetical protein [Chitinophagaceae bacterium]
MTWFNVVGLISSIALLLPIIIILSLRLALYKSFPALLAYYVMVFSHSFLSLDFIRTSKAFVDWFGIFTNFLDAPLMLAFMTYFSRTALFRQRMKMVIPILLLFEVIIIAIYGFSVKAAVIVLAPGLILVLGFALLFFIHQAKITVMYQKAAGKAFIAASLLFAYGGYAFIYVVYYLLKTPYKSDTYIVYYLITIFSSMLLAAGIFMERKRVRELTEIKIAREELRMVYGRS